MILLKVLADKIYYILWIFMYCPFLKSHVKMKWLTLCSVMFTVLFYRSISTSLPPDRTETTLLMPPTTVRVMALL